MRRYFHLFTTGMKNKWPDLHYIDLFAGAGVAKLRDTGELVFTSALLAAQTDFPFRKLHLCDADPENCSALDYRLKAVKTRSAYDIHCGDANSAIDDILRSVPVRSCLCLTFADPFGLHFDFETVRKISGRRSDLIVLMADNMDALRNWSAHYLDNPRSNLDRFMGEPGWRETLSNAVPERQAEKLRDRYRIKLEELGYSEFAHERIQNSQGADIYSLLYASRNPKGLEFWRKATIVDESGQRMLGF